MGLNHANSDSKGRMNRFSCCLVVKSCQFFCDPMRFPRQGYWSELPFPSLGDLPDPGIKPTSLVSPELAGGFFTTEPSGKPMKKIR